MKIGYGNNTQALEAAGCKILYKAAEFTAMIGNIRPGDVLVVTSLQVLSEYLPEVLDITLSLRDRGIGFISITDGVDTTEHGGVMLYGLLGALNGLKLDIGRGAGRKSKIDPKAFEKDVKSGMTSLALASKYGVSNVSVWRYKKAISQQ